MKVETLYKKLIKLRIQYHDQVLHMDDERAPRDSKYKDAE
jgi:hypothetical protein